MATPGLAESFTGVSPDALVPLESVMCTGELARRPVRAPDYELESRALALLVQALADSPRTILQVLADTILRVFKVDSAGISLLTKDEKSFVWPAVAGGWRSLSGNGTPRDFGPCGDVLDLNAPQLFRRPHRRYGYLLQATPLAEECLLLPFCVKGKAVGTIWAVAHNDRRKFDAEDLRQLQALGRFAAAAYQTGESLDETLALMDDSLQSQSALETLNAQLRESEERYHMLFESLDEGFCVIEKIEAGAGELPDFRFVEANPAFAVQCGVSGVVGKTLRELFGDESREWCKTYDAVCTSGNPIRFEREFVSQGRDLELYAFRVPDKLHCRVAVNFQDITERKRAQKLLSQNRDTFLDLIEKAPFGLCVVDSQFCLLQVSAAAKKWFGNINPLVGRNFEDVARLIWADPYVSRGLERFRHTLETGEPFSAPIVTQQRLDVASVESYDWTIERITLPSGQFAVVCYFYDITERTRSDLALRESEAFSRSIFDSTPDCIKVLDFEGNLVSMQSGQELLGIEDIKPFLNKSWLDFWVGEDRLSAKSAVDAAVAGEEGHFVGFFRTFRGEAKWWEVTISPIRGADGKAVRLLAVSRDVTQRKLDEKILRQSEERFRALVMASSDLMCRMSADWGEMREIYDNKLVVNTKVANRNWLDKYVYRDDQQRLMALVKEAIRTKSLFEMEHRVRRADGSWGWMSSRAVPLLDDDGEIVEWFGTGSDVTEHKRAEQSLRDSEERFRALFDRGPIAMYSCDASGTIQEFNRNAVLLWGREPVRGNPEERFCGASKLLFPDGNPMPHAQSPIAAVLKGEPPIEHGVEVLIERADGTRTTIIANIVPLINDRGEITGAINCMYDITERSRLERKTVEQAQKLVELDRRKDEFLAMLSHELRNPLAPLSNAVQLLRLHKNDDPVQQQAHGIIERQVGQLKHLVDDLLEVSRITTGSVRLRQERISLSDVVERAVETAQPLISQHRHELALALPRQPVFLHADAARLEQVLVNLLTNAAKYTDDGGHIWLSLEQEGEASDAVAVVRVRDSGIGIDAELLPRIFDLFTQAERSLDRSEGGLGIGLSLARRLVELHGGSVKACSTPGQGSEFVVRLPVMPSALPPSPVRPVAPSSVTSRKVLVVDDNVDAVRSLANLLTLFGHDVQIAYDGQSGLEAAQATRPDCVLLDIGLPGLTGLEVAELIRQQPELDGTVLVALTGYGREADRRLSHDAGFDHHLVKPADFSEVQTILASVGPQPL